MREYTLMNEAKRFSGYQSIAMTSESTSTPMLSIIIIMPTHKLSEYQVFEQLTKVHQFE